MKETMKKKPTETFNRLKKAGIVYIISDMACDQSRRMAEKRRDGLRELEAIYGKHLKLRIERAIRPIYPFGCFRILISPMVNHSTDPWTCKPWVRVSWQNPKGKFELQAIVADTKAESKFISRVLATLKINE